MTIVLAKLGKDAVATPTFSIPNGSEVEVGKSVTISSKTEGATIIGSINETMIEGEALPYTYTFTTAGDYTIEVVASKDGLDDSEEAKATYKVVNPKVATPIFSIASGSTFEVGEKLTISSETDGATITGFINETPIDGEALPYTYTFTTAGDYTIEVVASKDGLDDSEEAKATYTVTEFAAPAAPVFSLADMSSTPAGTVVSISAQGATSIVVKTYGIDGLVAATKTIEGNAATVTVDKMHRRFAAAAVRAANGNSATSTEVEAFYNIGNRGDAADTYTLVTSTDELYDGMEFVIGVEGTQNIVMTTSANNYDRIWYGGAATFSNNEVTTLPDNAMILVLEAAPNGEWYLRTKNEISYYDNADEDKSYRNTPRIGYLYDYSNPQNTSQNYLQMSSQPKASTPIAYNDNDGNATITFGIIHDAESDFIIRYNTNTTPSGFSMYATTMSANSYPLPRIYAKKAAIIEPDGYTMAFHHTPVALNNGQNKIAAVENPVALTATDNEDGTYTFTSNAGDITDLCGQFAVSVEGELLSGHISEAKTDFSDNHDSNCQATEHAPYVVVINNETKTLALASNENSVPLSTNTDDHHGKTVHHAAPVISVNLNPFRNINMTLASPEGTVTGIEDITVEGGEVEYYNLQGIRVANPENGIFIRREGNKATKVIL
ncbi:MAG: hypothetical protein Q4C34_05235 [Bacteroidales bacterium]|nr:hypothetical protein [Bacteroidales bacterium]